MPNGVAHIIRDIVESLGEDFQIQTFADDWVIEITHKAKKMLIYGYNFPNNNAAATHLCNDKSACSEFLFNYKIPCVEHYFIDPRADINDIKEICDEIGYPIIVKDNNGTCGQHVYRVLNFRRVMYNTRQLWKRHMQVSICAEEDVADEYRLIFFNEEPVLCYKKTRPYVIGNGEENIADLMKKKGIENKYKIDCKVTIERGLKQDLTWKHNLCLGSTPFIIKDPNKEMVDLAKRAVSAVGIKFCSVDVFKLKNDSHKILEINGGVMMKYLAQSDSINGYKLAFDIYKKAISRYFDL